MPFTQFQHNFDTIDRGKWIAEICELQKLYSRKGNEEHIVFNFSDDIRKEQLEPVHLVTLACLIQFLYDRNYKVFLSKSNEELSNYIFNDLNFSEYWKGHKNHVDAKTSYNIFNLWRIVDSEKDSYASYIVNFFNRNYFRNKDLSALSVSLVEAFYNVFDHAKAQNNAFMLLRYEEDKQMLQIAISDFGIGIANSVRQFNSYFARTDIDAITWAIRDRSTVKSTKHNKGMGMGNILAIAKEARIFSGNGIYVIVGESKRAVTTTFAFPGTLIYLNVDLSTFDDEIILDTFNW